MFHSLPPPKFETANRQSITYIHSVFTNRVKVYEKLYGIRPHLLSGIRLSPEDKKKVTGGSVSADPPFAAWYNHNLYLLALEFIEDVPDRRKFQDKVRCLQLRTKLSGTVIADPKLHTAWTRPVPANYSAITQEQFAEYDRSTLDRYLEVTGIDRDHLGELFRYAAGRGVHPRHRNEPDIADWARFEPVTTVVLLTEATILSEHGALGKNADRAMVRLAALLTRAEGRPSLAIGSPHRTQFDVIVELARDTEFVSLSEDQWWGAFRPTAKDSPTLADDVAIRTAVFAWLFPRMREWAARNAEPHFRTVREFQGYVARALDPWGWIESNATALVSGTASATKVFKSHWSAKDEAVVVKHVKKHQDRWIRITKLSILADDLQRSVNAIRGFVSQRGGWQIFIENR